MSKLIASLAVVVVMVGGSSALASGQGIVGGVLHFQDFSTIMENGVTLLHGNQDAQSSNYAVIQNEQFSLGNCGTIVKENQLALFNQVGNATGCCSLIDLDQVIAAGGTQQQTIGDGVGLKSGVQSLSLSGLQLANKGDGQGNVNGQQTMILNQGQDGTNTAGPMNQSSFVTGMQNTNVNGAPGATGAAGSQVLVTTLQEQAVY